MDVTILAKNLQFPEGPVVTNDGRIFFVELLGGTITEFHRESSSISRHQVNGAPNGLLVKDEHTLLFCDSKNNSIRSFDINTFQTETLVDSVNGEPLSAPNDLIKDQEGRILFTCPGASQNKPIGYICVIDQDNHVSVIADNMFFPNGLLLLNNDQDIIINETWKHRLVIGKWNKKLLKIEHIKSFYDIGNDAEPDGLTLSRDGLIYAAVFNTSKVWAFNTEGRLQKQIPLPGKCPTNLCFDQTGELGLLVTEAEKGNLLAIKE